MNFDKALSVIEQARLAHLERAKQYAEENSLKFKCDRCDEPIEISVDENVALQTIHSIYPDPMAPFFVSFKTHDACEAVAAIESQKRYDQEQRERLTRMRTQAYDDFVSSIDFPNSESVDLRAVQGLELLKSWKIGDEFGFIIRGPTGTGKSYAAVGLAKKIAREVLLTKEANDFHEHSTSSSLEDRRRLPCFIKMSTLFEKSIGNEFKVPSQYIYADFLFLDDLGTENITDFKREIFYNLIDRRGTDQRPTFITTNLSLDQLKERFYERVTSRILGMCVPVELTGKDKRLNLVEDRINLLRNRMTDDGKAK